MPEKPVNMSVSEGVLRLFATIFLFCTALVLPFFGRRVVFWALAGLCVLAAYGIYVTAANLHCPLKHRFRSRA